ncbi:MAG: periplasmic heavy metal sensor [Verrucomicrobiota bacterium]|nr:periplasmic heavy metal sensor [Verrucomicrobiota bacterium]
MKKLILLLVVLLAVGAGAYWLTYTVATKKKQSYMLSTDQKTLAWLQKEYQLSPGQIEKVKTLHDDYQPVCIELCGKINESNELVKKMINRSDVLTPDLATALDENARIRTECHRNMLEHVYAVAAVMSPEQSKRYLLMMSTYMMSPSRSIDDASRNQEKSTPHDHGGH